MKKSLLALVALGAFAGAAHAQSSVTLYGIIDEGLLFNNNSGGKHLYSMASGVMQGSRFGLRGTEDLGGGLKAIFTLENGFDVNTGKLGQGSLMFGRQAYVGLSSNYGTVTLGRQYDSVVDFVGPLEAGDQWGGYIAAHPGDLDNFNNAYRVNNAIKYTSPTYAGFSFGGLYSLGGIAGQFARNQVWSLGAGYNNGPLVLGVGYLNARTPGNAGGMFNNGSTASADPVSSPVYGAYANNANTYQVIGAGGAYTFGAATIGATYSNTKFKGFSVGPYVNQTATFNNGEINFKYQLTPALILGAAYDYTQGSKIDGNSAAKYHQGSLGVDYFLSKRTDVYVIGVYQHASGNVLDANGDVVKATAAINGLSGSSTSNQVAARVGIRHKF
ncbi:porin [Burkholderia pseudomultivorans]|uniref:Porin n=1 Tax=Burkholderia pseudomultivorans TaxID=1207504 RepID=A0A132ECB7_9BURK|nr:porin [Burkholderia pseudomultivorans]KWF24478.1 porin [Burkholderia pseudomultivorans]MDR8728144.1 Outer membrane porin protein [Burkholderia pseudomultivorans]MDR8735655.1 Outer membrane porin protein [Burkholderia pseudomultivorans]MDR8741410.1 Outer membrane porin protein [Burkholderia pseudomultivorans]MDR8757734.1 Outer membrane porin protein [Burkholderia pseudomultivorans]